ncbi:MAG: feruloyl-CoA synthase [Pseudomonadota bacterium]
MTDHLGLLPHNVVREDRADGSILLLSGYALGPVARSTGDWLHKWSADAPDRVFLAERSGEGWRRLSYAEVLQQVQAIAAALLDRQPKGPILILSGNSIDHALLSLAAHYVGFITVPVAEQYSLIPEAHGRLRHVIDLVKPGLVYAADGDAYGKALDMVNAPAIAANPGASKAEPFDTLLRGSGSVFGAHAAVGPDTVAKILMTSGSTSDPKGVITTQRMMTTNQTQIADGLPFLRARPPVLVDWLPWNHVFGGSHNFNLVLANGGSLYIDDGKPLPALFPRTLENLGLVSGTISFNVPLGFGQLVEALQADAALREMYFRDLDMIFYAGSSLPQDIWTALEDLAPERMPLITSSWGLTETAPAATQQHVPAKGAGIVGVPLPGVTVKLKRDGDGRFEVRVKGDNVTPGYWANPEKTNNAFDDEGFFITGDAMRFVDPDDLTKGLVFDGRTSEDFKLTSGTWVHAATLRLEIMAVLAPLAADLIVVGADRDEIGVLIVPNRAAGDFIDDGLVCGGPVKSDIRNRLEAKAEAATGSANRVVRALVMAKPPSMGEGEMTVKGNLNFAKVLQRRAELVERLYDDNDPASIVI